MFSEIIPCCEACVMPDGEWISADGNHLVEITNSRSIRPQSSIALDGASDRTVTRVRLENW